MERPQVKHLSGQVYFYTDMDFMALVDYVGTLLGFQFKDDVEGWTEELEGKVARVLGLDVFIYEDDRAVENTERIAQGQKRFEMVVFPGGIARASEGLYVEITDFLVTYMRHHNSLPNVEIVAYHSLVD